MFNWLLFWMIMGIIGGVMALIAGTIGATYQWIKEKHGDK